jgi:hypothetical protein
MTETTNPAEINLHTFLKRAENLLFSEIDQDKVMIDIERGAYFGLNPVAGEIWEMLDIPKTPQQVIETLLQAYEVDEETCKNETLQVLQRMVHLKLVEIVGGQTITE